MAVAGAARALARLRVGRRLRAAVRDQAAPVVAPGARPLLAAALLGRLPAGMMSLAIVLLMRAEGFGFAQAGAIVAGQTVASALSTPWLGRLVDRFGQTRILVALGLAWPAAVVALLLAVTARSLPAAAVAAAAAGATFPPVSACLRTAWPALLPTLELRQRAYALEAAIQEVTFLGGPVVAGTLAVAASPAVAVVVAGCAGMAGTLLFAATDASRRLGRPGRRRGRLGLGPLRVGGIRAIMLAFLGFGATWSSLALVLAAVGEERGIGEQAGFGLAAYALGSLVGGLWASARPPRRGARRRFLLMAPAAAALLAPLLAADGLLPLLAAMTVAGLPLAPALGSAYALLSQLAPDGAETEAFTWLNSAVYAGGAAGASLAGAGVAAAGATAGVLALIGFLAFSAIAAAAGRGALEVRTASRATIDQADPSSPSRD